MAEERRAAFYAARPGVWWRDWWTVLHPPYTLWHLSYVVIGACLAPHVDGVRLVATLLAFFFAVGVSAHALDELCGRPLGTKISAGALKTATALGLLAALGLGVAGIARVGVSLVPFLVIGPLLVLAYNAELFGGLVHTDAGFAAAWGAFPVLTAYVAQTGRLSLAALFGAAAAFALSAAQRALSTPARALRRRADVVEGSVRWRGGGAEALDRAALLQPLERALQLMAWALVALAAALAVVRLG